MRSVQCCTSDRCLSQCECECVCVCVCVSVCECGWWWWWWGGGPSSVILKRGEGGQGREGVQLPDSLVDEAVFQSVCPGLETPQSPP